MILAAATVATIERQFRRAAGWCAAGAVLSALGLMHAYRWTAGDTVVDLVPAWDWARAYALMALVFALAPWLTTPAEGH